MTSTHCPPGSTAEPRSEGSEGLRAELRVRPQEGHACPLSNDTRERTVTGHDIVCPDGSCGSGCECRSIVETPTGSRMVGKRMEENCVCPVFRDHDCVASIEAVKRGDIVVSLSLPSRDVLSAVIEGLRDRGATVELRSIARSGSTRSQRQLMLDAGSITDKQREAIEVAFEEGYYETPRDADLGDLADRLGVSRSAVSQRLTAAESTLIEQLYELESSVGSR
ncbi:helix-turn-helix domain-containing protein [Halorubrum sp. DTA98]|uniref:helix-turn-helix domain-containing protein n=1 Tax=Halorubrum sp. DTA98 TaxID=3402163 RepID=UPI003AAD2FCE